MHIPLMSLRHCPALVAFTALLLSFTAGTTTASAIPADEARPLLEKWMKTASQVKTVQAEFEQLRTLSTVRVPLRKQGKMWMEKAGGFRWQLGEPPTMTVLRDKAGNLTVLDAKEKKASTWSKEALLNEEKQGRGQGFAMLDAMQTPSLAEFEKTFEIKEATQVPGSADQWRFELELRDRKAGAFVRQVQFTVNVTQGTLSSMLLVMRDKSTMATNIKSVRLNEAIPASVFKLDTSGYTVETKQ